MRSVRTICLPRAIGSTRSRCNVLRVELDSHADTCVVGRHALIIHEHPKVVMVSGFDPSQPARKATVVDAAIKYTRRDTGDPMILLINQAILVPEVDHCLLCPMQCRINGVEINEVPRFLTSHPTTSSHSIVIADPTDDAHHYTIPLQLEGVVSYFEYTLPTSAEFEDENIPHLELTAEGPAWEPYDDDFALQEESHLDFRGHLISAARSDGPCREAEIGDRHADASREEEPHWKLSPVSLQYDTADIHDDDNLGVALEANVQVSLVKTCLSPETYDVCNVHTGKRKGAVDHITLANRWQISLEKAQNTVQRTTQRGVRTVLHPTLSRRFRTNDRMLRYRRMPCNLYSDTMFCPKVPSARGYTMAQIFATDFGWSRSFPMSSKSQAHDALSLLFAREGVPPKIIVDNAKEMKLGEFARKCKEARCYLRGTEPYSPWSNSAEREIRELKKGAARKLTRSGAPRRLWCFALEYESYIRSHTAHDIFQLDGRVPETVVSGETADISPFCEFGFWDWVKFRDKGVAFPSDQMVLGKYLGHSIDVGPAMTQRVMKANGEYEDRSTLRQLTPEERVCPALHKEKEEFLASVCDRWGPKTTIKDLGEDVLNLDPDPTDDPWEDEDGPSFPELDDELAAAEAAGDYLVNSEVLLPVGDGHELARVLRRKRDSNGVPVGTAHKQPAMDTRVYEVRFPDGRTEELAANTIAEALYAQCDPDGNQYVLLDAIVDYRRDPDVAVRRNDQVKIVNGKKVVSRSTRGWELCCEWKDGSTSWQKLSDLKESHPLQVAEFALAAGIADEPAFNWWVSWVLKKRDRIISLVKRRSARYHKRTHKFGIELPKTVEEAYAIDKATGTTFWRDAIELEMKNVRVAFDVLPDGVAPPSDHQYMKCHMIFDVKMEDFRRKARLVAGGHMTKAPATLTYASVVSRETVRIALLMAALNDVDIWAADVLNAYITAPCREKIWTTLGKEFGDDCGRKAIIVRALYGLKSSGAAFRAHLAGCLREMGYRPCLADPDLWLKKQTDRKGNHYYAYILCYVDDLLVVHHNPKRVMDRIDSFLPLKPGSIGPPEMYLGAKLKKKTFDDGTVAWGLSPSKYVQQAVRNVETFLKTNLDGRYSLPKRAENPFPCDYAPDEDVSPLLEPDVAKFYMQLIGILRWMCELGRIDICTEVSMLSSYSAMPREGHLEATLHVFSFLKSKSNSRLILDPMEPDVGKSDFVECDWREFYAGATEAVPPNAPKPLGKGVTLRMFVDSDHAGDKVSRRSRTGFVIFLNHGMIDWLSKKQSTIEASVFGAEFSALRHGIENLRGIRYKLRMMGVPVDKPSYVYGDNMSVVTNVSRPESTLKKKSNSICYHAVREAVAMGEALVAHIPTKKNLADLFTKVLYGQNRRFLVNRMLWDVYPST